MSIIKAIVLGVIQGIASFLPVSGSGLVVLFADLLGAGEISLKFLTILHLGSLIASILVFYRDLIRIFRSLVSALGGALGNLVIFFQNIQHPEEGDYLPVMRGTYRCMAILLLTSLIPAGIIGMIVRNFAAVGAGNLLITAMGFFVTALLLMVSSFSEGTGKRPESTKLREALLIGVFLGISVIPGISRIGMVLAAGSLCGFSRKYMAKYACLLSVPAMAGSILIELFDRETSLASDGGLVPLAAGVLFCAAAGYLFVRIARKLLVRVSNRSFAGCCLFAGIASILVYVF